VGELGTRVNALVLGGLVGGLALAVLLDLGWRLLAWEARHFSAQLRALHLLHAPKDPDPPAGK
jgi:hypothetical protein